MHVTIPWGTTAVLLLQIFAPVIETAAAGLVFWLVAKYAPAPVKNLLIQLHADRLLERAIGAGLAKTEGAVAGQRLEVTVANQVLAEALRYVCSQAPKFFKYYGPKVEEMLIARLGETGMLPPESTAETIGSHHVATTPVHSKIGAK